MIPKCTICGCDLRASIRKRMALFVWGRTEQGQHSHPMLICKSMSRGDRESCDTKAEHIIKAASLTFLFTHAEASFDEWKHIITEYAWSKDDLAKVFSMYASASSALRRSPPVGSFAEFCFEMADLDTARGDFCGDVKRDWLDGDEIPSGSWDEVKAYLSRRRACKEAMAAGREAWRDYIRSGRWQQRDVGDARLRRVYL
jgi:hypothetical protein